MNICDIDIPSKKVVITNAFNGKPPVEITVYGLNTEDFIRLAETHAAVLSAVFLRNSRDDVSSLDNSRLVMSEFPSFGASCIAYACKQPEAVDHVKQLPALIQAELLAAVFETTCPNCDGLKKNLERLAKIIVPLLKK